MVNDRGQGYCQTLKGSRSRQSIGRDDLLSVSMHFTMIPEKLNREWGMAVDCQEFIEVMRIPAAVFAREDQPWILGHDTLSQFWYMPCLQKPNGKKGQKQFSSPGGGNLYTFDTLSQRYIHSVAISYNIDQVKIQQKIKLIHCIDDIM